MLLYPLVLFVAALPFAPQSVVHSVEVRGAPSSIELKTRQGEPVNQETLTKDVRALWATGRYSDIKVEQKDTPDGVDIVFHLTPAPSLRLRKFSFDPDGDRLPFKIDPGAKVDPASAAAVGAKLRQNLVADGHADAQVSTTLVPAGPGEVDLVATVETGPREVIREVNFSGDLGIEEDELRRALKATKVRRILPKIWTSRPPFSDSAVQSDIARLRSYYISKGYLDAQVRLENVERTDGKVTITIGVKAGPRFAIRHSQLVNNDKNTQTPLGLTGTFSGREVCACLFIERRKSEKEGRLDFDVNLRADDAPPPGVLTDEEIPEKWVDLTAEVTAGPPYRVGRIEIRGNHAYSDSTVRRVFKLNEGDLLDSTRLRESIGRINQLGLFQTLEGNQVYVVRDAATGTADIRVMLKEGPRGRWFLSGPVGPSSAAGPLQAAVETRLPGWGRGILETSTYVVSFSLMSWVNPLSTLLPLGTKTGSLVPMIFIRRPFLEGQGWLSGFVISPQLGWEGMLMSYGMTQAHRRLKGAIAPPVPQPPLTASFERGLADRGPIEAGALLCEAPRSRWYWFRVVGSIAVDVALGANPF